MGKGAQEKHIWDEMSSCRWCVNMDFKTPQTLKWQNCSSTLTRTKMVNCRLESYKRFCGRQLAWSRTATHFQEK